MTALLVKAQVKARVHGMVALRVALRAIPISHRLSTTKINLTMSLACLPTAAIQGAIILSVMTAGIRPPMAAIQGVIIPLGAMTGTQILGLPILGDGNQVIIL